MTKCDIPVYEFSGWWLLLWIPLYLGLIVAIVSGLDWLVRKVKR